ncbi:glycosyltransferase family 4 protein [Candidatus Poribacteria bacterium]|nr:glycosyltransferase family 4 protein [Candidatus Poribacteria bacterium]
MYYLAYFLAAIIISMLITYTVNFYFRKHRIFDIPNERSSHQTLTPRSGGLGIVITWFVLLLFVWKINYILIPILLIAVLGQVDDIKSLPVSIRFSFQIIAAIFVAINGSLIEQIKIPFFNILPLGIFAFPLTIFWLVAMTNIYNFMDGIDGLSGGYGVIIAFFMLYFAFKAQNSNLIFMTLLLAGACIGFTFLNFPPAKIFMGDVGSTFLGFTFAFLAIKLSNNGIELLGFIILLGAFIFDTSITLVRRIINGEKWFMSHRSHYYQRLLKVGYSHKTVTLSEYILTILLGIISVFFVQSQDLIRMGLLITAVVILIGCIMYINYIEGKEKKIKEDA